MVQRYTPAGDIPRPGDPAPTPSPSPPPPGRRRFRINLLGAAVFVIALVAGLVLFGILASIGETVERPSQPPGTPAASPSPDTPGARAGVSGTPEGESVHARDHETQATITAAASSTAAAKPAGTQTPGSLPPAPAPAADVPPPPNCELISLTTETQSASISRAYARYQSREEATEVERFYQSELPKLGWQQLSSPGTEPMIYAKSEDGIRRTATIEAVDSGAGAAVTVQVTLPVNK